MNQERPRPLARVITVTSGKGGVGKSNTSINLAIQLKKLGQRVVILDADFGLANIEIMFGAVPQFNLSDLIYKGKDITEIITWGPGLYYPQSGKAGFYSGRDHCGHGSGHFGCCTGISGGEQRGASGNDTGTDLHYRFVFSVKSTRASSAFFQ